MQFCFCREVVRVESQKNLFLISDECQETISCHTDEADEAVVLNYRPIAAQSWLPRFAGIAEFLEKLARAVPPEWLADPKRASSSIDLHELASNLAQIEAKEADSHAADGHDCELFD